MRSFPLSARRLSAIAVAIAAVTFAACRLDTTSPLRFPHRAARDTLLDSALTVSSDTTTLFDTTVVYTDSSFLIDTTSVVVPTDTTASLYPATPLADLTPLACPNGHTRAARGWIGPEGGTVGAGGAVLTLPAGAIADSTKFEVIVPVSPVYRVEIHALDSTGAALPSFLFAAPAKVTLNLSRCTLPPSRLEAGYVIDSTLRQIMQVGGIDRSSGKYAFPTGHLSGFIVFQ